MKTNPYQSPTVPTASVAEAVPSDTRTFPALLGMWALMFGLNLPAPLLFATAITRNSAWLGIGFALFVILALGAIAAKLVPKTIEFITIGGFLTAFTQLFPVGQMIVGSIVLGFCTKLELTSNPYDMIETIHGPIGGFVATILTSIPFLLFAFVVGFLVRKFRDRNRR